MRIIASKGLESNLNWALTDGRSCGRHTRVEKQTEATKDTISTGNQSRQEKLTLYFIKTNKSSVKLELNKHIVG